MAHLPMLPKAATTKYGGKATVVRHCVTKAEQYAQIFSMQRPITARERDNARVIMTPRVAH